MKRSITINITNLIKTAIIVSDKDSDAIKKELIRTLANAVQEAEKVISDLPSQDEENHESN